MKRFEKTVFAIGKFCLCSKRAIAITIATALVVPAIATAQQSDQALLDRYLSEIERLISGNDLEGARDKLAEATSANLEDESLEIINSQLRLLESLNTSARRHPGPIHC